MGFRYMTQSTANLLQFGIGQQVVPALNNCIKRIKQNQANAALLRWFGDASAAYKATLIDDLEKLRRICNLQDIAVRFRDVQDHDRGENAAGYVGSATSIDPRRMRYYDGQSIVQNVGFTGGSVFLNVHFSSMNMYLPYVGGVPGTVDSTAWHQSRFETFVHELSHVVLSTADHTFNGQHAYGRQNAAALAVFSPALAKTNAENWGIFIEAVGVKNAS
jgi:hypothetical protein